MTITGVTIDGGTNVSGFNSSDVSFDGTHVWVNMSGLTPQNGQQVVLDLAASPASPTPEPSTVLLFATGIALIGLSLKKIRA